MSTKVCFCCKNSKSVSDFYKNKDRKDKLASYCKQCAFTKSREFRIRHGLGVNNGRASREVTNAKALARYHANKDRTKQRRNNLREHILDIERRSRLKNKGTYRPIKNARQSIRNRVLHGKEFLITERDIRRIYSSPCIACGSTKNQSMEHLIPISRGGNHSIGNIATLCFSCNVSKGAKLFVEWKYAKQVISERM